MKTHSLALIEIGKKIASLRKDRKLTQTELAQKACIHRVRLSEIENGSPCSIVTLLDLLTALDRMDILSGLINESYDDLFTESTCELVSSFEELKANRSNQRSNVRLPDNLFKSYGARLRTRLKRRL
jgi:transcriptional regulator with XRE-family HTH domain